MDAQKLWTPLVRYDGETWRFPREKMNNGVNIQTASPEPRSPGRGSALAVTVREKGLRFRDRLCYTY